MRRRSGSTLVELLVVIAIAAILLAIIFVVARGAWRAVQSLDSSL